MGLLLNKIYDNKCNPPPPLYLQQEFTVPSLFCFVLNQIGIKEDKCLVPLSFITMFDTELLFHVHIVSDANPLTSVNGFASLTCSKPLPTNETKHGTIVFVTFSSSLSL